MECVECSALSLLLIGISSASSCGMGISQDASVLRYSFTPSPSLSCSLAHSSSSSSSKQTGLCASVWAQSWSHTLTTVHFCFCKLLLQLDTEYRPGLSLCFTSVCPQQSTVEEVSFIKSKNLLRTNIKTWLNTSARTGTGAHRTLSSVLKPQWLLQSVTEPQLI